jgi:hypothetical protein
MMKNLVLVIALIAFLGCSTGAIAGADLTSAAITVAQKAAVADDKKIDKQLKAIQDDAAKSLAGTKKAKAKGKAKAKSSKKAK